MEAEQLHLYAQPVEAVSLADYERLAEERLERGAWDYFAGGAGDELTLRDNVSAYTRWVLRPRR